MSVFYNFLPQRTPRSQRCIFHSSNSPHLCIQCTLWLKNNTNYIFQLLAAATIQSFCHSSVRSCLTAIPRRQKFLNYLSVICGALHFLSMLWIVFSMFCIFSTSVWILYVLAHLLCLSDVFMAYLASLWRLCDVFGVFVLP